MSTEEQAKKGYSLEHQLEKCKLQGYKDHPNHDVQYKLYIDDGYSGEYLERPNLTRLREDVSSRLINEVYCYDPDRLARNLMHQLLIDEDIAKNSKLVFVNGEYEKTPEGILFFQLRGAIAQFEKAKINERMSNGRKSKAKRGKVVKDYKVYGYNYNRDLGKMEINEAEATIVRFIFDAFIGKISGFKGINGIALYLTEKEIPTKKGRGIWHRQVVRQIIMSKTYIGEFYQNKWNTEGSLGNQYKTKEDKIQPVERPKEDWILVACPTIIESAQFDHAQKLLQSARQRWSGISKNDYLLSGLLRCGTCGNTMTGRKTTNWGTKVFQYTDIKNTAGFKNKGCGRHIRCDKLDNEVWETMYQRLLNSRDSSIEEKNEIDNPSFELNEKIRLEKLLSETEQGRKQFIKAIISGKLNSLSEIEQNEALMESQKKIEKIKLQIEEQDLSIKKRELQKGKVDLFKEPLDIFFSKDPKDITHEDKKAFIRMHVREIRIEDNDTLKIYGF